MTGVRHPEIRVQLDGTENVFSLFAKMLGALAKAGHTGDAWAFTHEATQMAVPDAGQLICVARKWVDVLVNGHRRHVGTFWRRLRDRSAAPKPTASTTSSGGQRLPSGGCVDAAGRVPPPSRKDAQTP